MIEAPNGGPPGSGRQNHRDSVCAGRPDEASWFQAAPRRPVQLTAEGRLLISAGTRLAPLMAGLALTGLGGEVIQVRDADDSEDDLADALAQAATHASRLLTGGDGGPAALVRLAAGPAS